VVECLPSKCEALISNASTAKKIRVGKKERGNVSIMEGVNLFKVHSMHVWN
jgi:hypothetical protein